MAFVDFFNPILNIYKIIIPIYCLTSLICSFFKINIVEQTYVKFLDRFFSFTAYYFAHKTESGITREESSEKLDAYETNLIERDVHLTEEGPVTSHGFICDANTDFKLHHPSYLVKSAIEAIIEDDVTIRFSAAELKVWNFLSRNSSYQFMSDEYNLTLNIIWVIGFMVRYLLLFPCRIVLFVSATLMLSLSCIFVGSIPNQRLKIIARDILYTASMRFCLRAFSGCVFFHNKQNRPSENSIVVANHTTPFDYIIVCADKACSIVGQEHNGFFGFMERVISRAIPSVWFDRAELLDRHATARKLRNHLAEPDSPPLLIFPEGTCINNTSVMKFKKGSFEIGSVVYPVVIKYDPRFADCFWNSHLDSLLQYMVKLMTSWAIVVDVTYLPPEKALEGETSIDFAKRVRQSIAKSGGLEDMEWDGDVKRKRPHNKLLVSQQKFFSKIFKVDGDTKENTE